MALITQARLHDDAVVSSKISSDAVVAADIDETVAYNWSSGSSTFSGVMDGVIVASGSTAAYIQTGQGTVAASAVGSSVKFETEMLSAPRVFIQSTSTSATMRVRATSTSHFTVVTDTAATIDYIAIADAG
jgi:hypothetical protein